MTESSLKTLIETTLTIPVYQGTDTITYPAATLEVTSLPAALIGDGKVIQRQSDVVINLWYKDKTTRDTAVGSLDTALQGQDLISVPDIDTYYDTNAKKYRAIFNFSFIPKEESNGL